MSALAKRTGVPDLPTVREVSLAKEASRVLSGLVVDDGEVNITVTRDEARIEATIPAAALEMIVEMLAHMSQGNAVTFIPTGHELTTQEAAHFLNVSRPYLIKLLENDEIPFYKVGRHRRVKFEDLKNYKAQRDSEQSKLLDEMTAESQKLAKSMGEGY